MNSRRTIATLICGFILLVAIVSPLSSGARNAQGPLNVVMWDSGRYVQLTWDGEPTAGIAGYNVYRSTDSPDNWQRLNEGAFALTTFVDYSAPRSKLVHYRVNQVTADGEELPSASVASISTSPAVETLQTDLVGSFDKNNIITDSQLINANAMSSEQIQSFLVSKGSVLANFSSGGKTAAQRIFDDCQTHGINPQVVLVTLQKEKGLITSSSANPNNLAMGWNTSDPTTADFANQIYFGTRQFRRYYDNLANYGWTVGQPHAVSDGTVTAANTTTAGLYVYTPWIGQGGGGQTGVGGNYLFWDLWYNSFAFDSIGTSAAVVSSGFDYPVSSSTTVTQPIDGDGWYNAQDFGVNDHLGEDWNAESGGNTDCGLPVFASSTGTIVYAQNAGTGWRNVMIIRHQLPDGSQVETLYGHLASFTKTSGTVNRREQIGTIGDDGAGSSCHLHFELRFPNCPSWGSPGPGYKVDKTGWTDPSNYINSHRSLCGGGSSESLRINGGPPTHPNGTLIKISSNGTVYVLQNGQKRGITSEAVLHNLYQQSNSNFDFKDVITVAADELNSYPTGTAVSSALPGNGRTQPDGRLISKPSGEVSIVTNNGGRRAFPSEAIFLGLGYQFCNVIAVSDTEYNAYTPVGPVVDGTAGCSNPGSFSLTSPGDGQSFTSSTTTVTLSWGTSANANSYDVYFGTSSNPPFLANQSGTSRQVSVQPGQQYWWKVVAKVNCSSTTATTSVRSFTVQPPCNAPGSVSLTSPSDSQSFSSTTTLVTLSWSATTNATSYDVYFGTSSNPPFLANQPGTSRQVSVQAGQTYWWKVVAKNDCGTATSSSPTRSFSVQTPCNPPGAFSLNSPSNGQSFVSNTSLVTLSWGASANAASYDVYFGTDPNPPFLGNQPGTTRQVSVQAGVTYFWKVVAKNTCGTFSSSIQSFNIQSITCNPPGAFSLTSPSDGQNLSSTTTVTLMWGASANADSYDVFFGTNSNPPFVGNQTGTTRQMTVADGQTYWWKVVAKSNCVSTTATAGVWSFSVLNSPTGVNVALSSAGAIATASSTFSSSYPASNANNGERAGANSSTGGVFNGWLSSSATMPQWLQVDFGQARSITEIDVFSVQDNYPNPSTPTLDMTFSNFGLQGFEVQYWNGSSWVTIPGGSVAGNNKVWRQFTFAAISTSKIRVLTNASPDFYSRITEVEAWTNSAPPPSINVALPANGGFATASSTFSSSYPASNANNGERAGANSSTGGVFNGWLSSSATMPQWLQVDFGQLRTITEIDVFTVQDNYSSPSTPMLNMTFSNFGLQGYEVQYWNGSTWVTVPGGSIAGNNKVWRQFTFAAISTSKIRVLTNASPDFYSRITEVEAWTNSAPPPSINVALPANGGVASASSTFSSSYPASNANNGEQAGANSSTGGVFNGWLSGSATMPQWLQVDFGQVRSITEIDVFTVQDNYPNPSPPTLDMTFSSFGLQGYEVQYWNGSSWVTISGGNVAGNNKVWRQFTFAAISTSKIRVLTNASPDFYSRVTEVEAWSPSGP